MLPNEALKPTVTASGGHVGLAGRVFGLAVPRVAYTLVAPLDAAARWRAVIRPKARFSGFAVFVRSEHISRDDAVAKLRHAVALLEQHAPRRCRRIRADVHRLVVCDQLHAGTHWERPRAVVLDGKILQQHPALWAAVGIIHEATHVRIRRAGLRTTNANRARIERRCVGEQIDFLRRVAAQDPPYAAQAQYYIDWSETALNSPTPWYEPEQKWARAREWLVAESAPRWILRLFDHLRPPHVKEAPDGA